VIYAYNCEFGRNDGKAENRSYGIGGKNEHNPRESIHFEKLQSKSDTILHFGRNLQDARLPAGGYFGIRGGMSDDDGGQTKRNRFLRCERCAVRREFCRFEPKYKTSAVPAQNGDGILIQFQICFRGQCRLRTFKRIVCHIEELFRGEIVYKPVPYYGVWVSAQIYGNKTKNRGDCKILSDSIGFGVRRHIDQDCGKRSILHMGKIPFGP